MGEHRIINLVHVFEGGQEVGASFIVSESSSPLVVFDSLQPSRVSASKMAHHKRKDYSALAPKKLRHIRLVIIPPHARETFGIRV